MADYKLLPGQGLMFNTHKRSSKFPDFKGQIRTPSGELLNIAGWFTSTVRIADNYLNIKLTPAEDNEPEFVPKAESRDEE